MKKILVIDDDAGVRVFMSKRFETEGYTPLVAATGEEGLHMLYQDKPQLVILDVMMPGVDGFTFMREMRADETLKKIPVIVATAREDLRDIFKMEGAQGFFVKPVPMDEVMEKVRALIG
jgi:DNA-binding response OmpR family regulator